jgi:Holliday junction resolvase-like predicted endonuclease
LQQRLNFFANEQKVNSVKEFGICDTEGIESPCFIAYDEQKNHPWMATVISNNRDDYYFIPVDKNIKAYAKEGSEIISECDAMLHTVETICFIEMKVQEQDWAGKAVKQLESTIKLFDKHHGLQNYKYKIAYACNTKHPNYHVSFKNVMQKFHQTTSVVLRFSDTVKEFQKT